MKIHRSLLFCSAVVFLLAAPARAEDKEVSVPAGIRQEPWTALLKKYVNTTGYVDYAGWKASGRDMAALDAYLAQFNRAGRTASGPEKAASLINAYNAFAIHWILQNYPTDSVWALDKTFEKRRHRVGGALVSLDDIEKGTLLPQLGYRAHSVVVCCARSCPPLQRAAYRADTLDEQIDDAYRSWLARGDLNTFEPRTRQAEVSMIFKWYKSDFDAAGGTKKILARYGPPEYRDFLNRGDYELKYQPYNWGLNAQGEAGRRYGKLNFYLDLLF